MNLRQIFLLSCLLFLIGDVLGIVGELYHLLSALALIMSLSFLVGLRMRVIGILMVVVSLGYALGYHAYTEKLSLYHHLQELSGNFLGKYSIRGSIEREMFRKERSRVFLMKIDTFDIFDKDKRNLLPVGSHAVEDEQKTSPSLFVEIPSNLTIRLGDIIEIDGKLSSNIEFPLKGFSRYAFFHGGFASIFSPTFEIIEKGGGSFFDPMRSHWKEIYERGFPREVAGTLLGMTIGSFDLLGKDLKNIFINSGTSHILVVSGSNIALLILFLTFFLKYLSLPKILRIIIISSIVCFYVGLVGIEVSVIRAAIMGILAFLAIEWGDHVSSRATLGLALVIAIILDPLGPLYDAAFGLSFSATLGIILFQKPVRTFLDKFHLHELISSTIALTLGASLGSLPLLLYHFEKITVAGLMANILIAFFLGWILFSAILYSIFSFLGSYVAYIFGYIVYIPTFIIIEISRYFSSFVSIALTGELSMIISVFLLGIYAVLYVST